MKQSVQVPAGVGAWQLVCERCGIRYAMLVPLDDDELAEQHRPRFCTFCAQRIQATSALAAPTPT